MNRLHRGWPARVYGKANHRKVLRMANAMSDEAKSKPALRMYIPDWAGLAWIISPFYNSTFRLVSETMGAVWMARAERLCQALKR